MPVLAVVSVLGKDQKGVVAQFATYMAERGINIEDIEQRVVRGFFLMDMLVDLKDLDRRSVGDHHRPAGPGPVDGDGGAGPPAQPAAQQAGRAAGQPEPHCLEQLIEDFREGRCTARSSASLPITPISSRWPNRRG